MEYQLNIEVTNNTEPEMFECVTWIRANLTEKVSCASGNSDGKIVRVTFLANDFSDLVSIITTLKTQYGSRVTWSFQAKEMI